MSGRQGISLEDGRFDHGCSRAARILPQEDLTRECLVFRIQIDKSVGDFMGHADKGGLAGCGKYCELALVENADVPETIV